MNSTRTFLVSLTSLIHLNIIVSAKTGPPLTGVMEAGTCDNKTEFRCSNMRCIALHKANNSINDCSDNSDESVHPCRYPMFSCTSSGRCILMDWVLDGINDCIDETDETKVIGTNCTSAINCCFCDRYVANSVCRDGVCQCDRGYYPVNEGTSCQRRRLGHPCETDDQCSAVVREHSRCSNNSCVCVGPYQPSADFFDCIPRHINDTCRADIDCDAADSLCVLGRCTCAPGHGPVSSGTRCRRLVGRRVPA